MEAVDLALDALRRGEPSPLLIHGEPGIGKTRLLAELDARAAHRGCIVLHGSASELERDLPFWIFVDALDEYVAGLDPRELSGLSDETLGEIAHMLPSASTVDAGDARLLQDERYRAHRAMRELLDRLALSRPLVLVLDDVHWADPASVDLMTALVRGAPGRASCSCSPRGRASSRIGCGRRWTARNATAPCAGSSSRACHATAAAELLGETHGRAPVRGDRRQPVLPRAAGSLRRHAGGDVGRRCGRRAGSGPRVAGGGARPAG